MEEHEKRELEQAEAAVEEAEREIKAATQDLGKAQHDLEHAEAEIHEIEKKHHEIHFFLDGEPCKTDRRELTPNQILLDFGHADTSTHYLVQIEGEKKISYQGKGDIPIKLQNGSRFQIISVGPTPIS